MEEHIGKVWHRFLSKKTNAAYESERVFFAEKSRALTLFYHLLGGDKGKALQITDKRPITTVRSLLQKVSGEGRNFFLAWQDDEGVYLPASVACFPEKKDNEMLYFWLIAMATKVNVRANDFVAHNLAASQSLLDTYPGFERFYEKSTQFLIRKRADLRIKTSDAQGKELSFVNSLAHKHLTDAHPFAIDEVYPFALWIYPALLLRKNARGFDDEPERGGKKQEKTETLQMKKQANTIDDKKKTDGLLMFLPDSLMSIMEQVNVDRSEDDSFDEDALSNAEDLDEITLGRKKANLGARIKMELDLATDESEEYPLGKGHFLPEWDYRKAASLENYVRITPIFTADVSPLPLPSRLRGTVKKIQNELDRMALERIKKNCLPYGDEVNLDTWIDYKGHQNKSGHHQKFYESFERKSRDMATLILADVSLSTEAGITQEIRIIDMIKDALMVFSESLQRVQDRFAIYAFSSLKNTNVRFHVIKDFKESYGDLVRGRIAEIKPGYYTRLGAAIRESTRILQKQQSRNRLLLIISDGKPNDVDRYDGRYGIEDTKKAISEAKKLGITPFCVTIDLEAKSYLAYLFGKNGYVLIRDGKKLPTVLPQIYMNLTL